MRALREGGDLLAADVAARGERLPAWYRRQFDAASFAFYALRVDGKLIGAIYVDCDRPGAIGPEEGMHLQTLRNQATLAVSQRQAR